MHQKKLRRTAPPSPGEMADVARDLLPSLREQLSDAERFNENYGRFADQRKSTWLGSRRPPVRSREGTGRC